MPRTVKWCEFAQCARTAMHSYIYATAATEPTYLSVPQRRLAMRWPSTMDSVPLPRRQCANFVDLMPFDLMTLHRPDPIHAHLQDSVKVLAKSLVRNRQYVTKMHHMKANLQAVSLKITVRSCGHAWFEMCMQLCAHSSGRRALVPCASIFWMPASTLACRRERQLDLRHACRR